MAKRTVSILGCGWLGLPLAKSLVNLGYTVKGSTTTPEKIDLLKQNQIQSFLMECSPQISGEDIPAFFESEVLVVTIPFRRNLPDPAFYYRQMQSVCENLKETSMDFVIFTSSTSVYPDHAGVVSEEDPFIPDNKRSQVLRESEQLFMQNHGFKATVLRLSGLYGGDRQIGRFLSGQTDLKRGQSPVNLVHQDDVVEIIQILIQRNIQGEIFNVCSDEHPSREELYKSAAERLNLKPPGFDDSDRFQGKIVSNQKLKERLNYRFQHPSPLN